MKNILAGVLASSVLAACGKSSDAVPRRSDDTPAGDAAARIFDMPYVMRDLDNGLRVIVVRTDYPDIVTLQIPVQTGSRNEVEPGKSGFAHFFEHMMFRGTEAYPAAKYAEILKKGGADQNAYTTDDYTNYHITFTKDDLEKMIEIEADRFRNLSYAESDFRTEALAVKGEYLKNFSNPTSKAYERIRSLAFEKHTYRHTTMGFIEDIEAMPDQLEYSRAFFDRWYRPEKTAVIVVGDVDPERTFEMIETYWGGWEPGNYDVDIPAEPPLQGPLVDHIRWEGHTQPYLFVAYRGPAYDPGAGDMPAMDVLASIYFSDSSALYRKLVLEDQSVDQLLTYFPDRKDPNLLLIYARLTEEKHAADVQGAIDATVAEARTALVETRKLEDTKSRLRYSFTSRLDSSGGIGAVLASFVQFDRTPETINEVYRTYESLTATDLRDFANRYLTDSRRVTLSLSNSPTMAGIDGRNSVDELVAAAGMADAPSLRDGERAAPRFDRGDRSGETSIPVPIVARQSASSSLIDVSVLVHAGAAMDPKGKKGLAALTAAMISDAGSENYTIQEINEAMYPIASGFHAQVDKEMTRLGGQVHRDNFDTWYALAMGQLLTPGWREQDFERVRTQLVNAIRTGLVGNNDEELGKEALYAALYGAAHPYGSLNLGAVRDLQSLTLDDVRQFYADFYTVRNVTIGLAGGYPDSLVTDLSADLQRLPAGERARPEIPPAPELVGRRALIVEKETPGVAVSFGFPIELRRGDPDWVALWLVRSYLGEHRSTNSFLFKRIREERGMNYGNYAYIEYFPRGMFQFHPDTNLGRQRQIFQVWIRPLRNNNDAHFATRTAMFELDRLHRDGMTETDYEATRSFLSKFVSLLTDGQSRQLGYAMDSEYYGIEDFAGYIRKGLDGLTLADVNRVIREQLDTGNVQYVFVTRDADDLKNRLTKDLASPVVYESAKPAALLEEDRKIDSLSLGLDSADVTVLSSDEMFH